MSKYASANADGLLLTYAGASRCVSQGRERYATRHAASQRHGKIQEEERTTHKRSPQDSPPR